MTAEDPGGVGRHQPPQPPERTPHRRSAAARSEAAWQAGHRRRAFLAAPRSPHPPWAARRPGARRRRGSARRLRDAAPSARRQIAWGSRRIGHQDGVRRRRARSRSGEGSNDGTDAELAGRSAFGVAASRRASTRRRCSRRVRNADAARRDGAPSGRATTHHRAGVAAAANALDDGGFAAGARRSCRPRAPDATRARSWRWRCWSRVAEAGDAAPPDAERRGRRLRRREAPPRVARALRAGAGEGRRRQEIGAPVAPSARTAALLRTASAAVSAATKGSALVVPERRVGCAANSARRRSGIWSWRGGSGVAHPDGRVAARATLTTVRARSSLGRGRRASGESGAEARWRRRCEARVRPARTTDCDRQSRSWLLAPCSPKSTVAGWGPEGAAVSLAILLALETSGSLVTRDSPAEAKLTSVSGIFVSAKLCGATPRCPRRRRCSRTSTGDA